MTQLTDNLYAVKVPEGARGFELAVLDGLNIWWINNDGTVGYHELEGAIKDVLPCDRPGHSQFVFNYKVEIIGLFNSITEEQARELVDDVDYGFGGSNGRYVEYKDYLKDGFSVIHPTQSLRSLLEFKGLKPSEHNYLLIKKTAQ